MTSIELVQTQDGSWTGYNAVVDQHYHNLTGACDEAYNLYVYNSHLEARLKASNHVAVLDPFLGLGYNSLACLSEFVKLKASRFLEAQLTVVTFENCPEILSHLPYVIENCGVDDLKKFLPLFAHNIYYQTQHNLEATLSNLIKTGNPDSESRIQLIQVVGDTRALVQLLPSQIFDLIYHDAFSPKKQPELWTTQLFQQYYRILKPANGRIITYSASAPARGALQSAGFSLTHPLGSCLKPGTIGHTSNADIEAFPKLDPKGLALMQCKSGLPFEDDETLTRSQEEMVNLHLARQLASLLPTSSSVHRQFPNNPNQFV